VIDGAIDLFGSSPIDDVTVQDIADAVEMTPAAVYYHFASKEQILLEAMRQFRDELVDEVAGAKAIDGRPDAARALVLHVVDWASRRRAAATVYFVSSIGLNLLVEALRRETRVALIEEMIELVEAIDDGAPGAEAGVVAVGLVSLIETSVASLLTADEAYLALGEREFRERVGAIADRVVDAAGAR